MTWTYDEEHLDDPLNALRLRIGDTVEARPLFFDEELKLFIDSTSSTQAAALAAFKVLEARAAREVDKWVGDLKILASQRHRQYQRTIEELEVAVAGRYAVPFAGGIRTSQKEAHEEDDDLVVPSFRRGLHDYVEDP